MGFQIIKKLNMPSAGKGLILKSIKGDIETCQMVLMCSTYGAVKNAVESYRMLTGRSISFRARGKSLEVTTDQCEDAYPIASMMEFCRTLPFMAEDPKEIAEFYTECVTGDRKVLPAEAVSVSVTGKDMTFTFDPEPDEEEMEALTAALSPFLDKYNMGIMK